MLKNIASVASGSAVSQLILIAASPFVTRLYTPAEFGVFAVIVSAISIISIVSALRYELAIPLPRSESSVANIIFVGILFILVTFTVSVVVLWSFNDSIITILGLQDYSVYLFLIPVGATLSAVYLIFHYLAVRRKNYRSIATTRVYQAIVTVLCQTGASSFGVLSLVLAQFFGQLIGIFGLHKNLKLNKFLPTLSLRRAYLVAVRYKAFPLYSTAGALANVAGTQLVPIMLVSLYSASISGFYALAFRVAGTPLTVLSEAIGSVFYASAVQAERQGDLAILVARIQSVIFRLFAPLFVLASLYSANVFEMVFGADWLDAGEVAAVMMPWFMLQLMCSPLSYVFAVKGKESISAKLQYSQLLVRLTTLVVAAQFFEPLTALTIYASVSFLFYVIYLGLINRLCGLPFFCYFVESRFVVAFLMSLSVIYGIVLYFDHREWWVYIVSPFLIFFYYIIVFLIWIWKRQI